MITQLPNSKFKNQNSKIACHGSSHALSRLVSRVKRQKSFGKTDIVTVSRVKAPGEVSQQIAAPRPVGWGEGSRVRGQLSDSDFRPEPGLRSVAIRGNPRLTAPIRGMNYPDPHFNVSTIQRFNAPEASRTTASHFDLLRHTSTFSRALYIRHSALFHSNLNLSVPVRTHADPQPEVSCDNLRSLADSPEIACDSLSWSLAKSQPISDHLNLSHPKLNFSALHLRFALSDRDVPDLSGITGN
jgi:hypothetical protein